MPYLVQACDCHTSCNGVVPKIYFGSQIPVITGQFELQISYIQSNYLTLVAWSWSISIAHLIFNNWSFRGAIITCIIFAKSKFAHAKLSMNFMMYVWYEIRKRGNFIDILWHQLFHFFFFFLFTFLIDLS